MRTGGVLLCIVIVSVLAPAAGAVRSRAGMFEFSPQASLASSVSTSDATYSLSFGVGYFAASDLSVGARIAVNGAAHGETHSQAWGRLMGNIHESATTMPFVGIGLGTQFDSGSERGNGSTGLGEVYAGLRAFVSEASAIVVELRYETPLESLDSGVVLLQVGFSVFSGGSRGQAN